MTLYSTAGDLTPCGSANEVIAPLLHQLPLLVEQIAPHVSLLNAGADAVRQCCVMTWLHRRMVCARLAGIGRKQGLTLPTSRTSIKAKLDRPPPPGVYESVSSGGLISRQWTCWCRWRMIGGSQSVRDRRQKTKLPGQRNPGLGRGLSRSIRPVR